MREVSGIASHQRCRCGADRPPAPGQPPPWGGSSKSHRGNGIFLSKQLPATASSSTLRQRCLVSRAGDGVLGLTASCANVPAPPLPMVRVSTWHKARLQPERALSRTPSPQGQTQGQVWPQRTRGSPVHRITE